MWASDVSKALTLPSGDLTGGDRVLITTFVDGAVNQVWDTAAFGAASGTSTTSANPSVTPTPPSSQGPDVSIQPGSGPGICLTAESNSEGAVVDIQPCGEEAGQDWVFANGAISVFDGSKCLDVTNGVDADGTNLQVWDCVSGNANQQWTYSGANQ